MNRIRKYYKILVLLLPFYLYNGLYWATLFSIISFFLIEYSEVKDQINNLDWREVIFFAYLIHLLFGERDFTYVGIGKLYITEITLAVLIFMYRKELFSLKKMLSVYYLLTIIAGIWAIAYLPFYKINALRDALMLGYVIWVPIVYTVFDKHKKFDLFIGLVKVLIVVKTIYYIHRILLIITGHMNLATTGLEGFRFGVGIIVPGLAVMMLLLPLKEYNWKYRICSLVLILATFTEFHRSMFLGIALAAIVFFIMGTAKTKKIMIMYGTIGAVLLVGFIIYYNTLIQVDIYTILQQKFSSGSANVNYRFMAWNQAITDFKNNPVLGYGLGKPLLLIISNKLYPVSNLSYWQIAAIPGGNAQPHNSYLNIFVRFGMFNFLIFLGGILYPLKKIGFMRKVKKLDMAMYNRYLLFLGFLIFMYTYAGFNVVLESPYHGVPFWISIGMVLRYSNAGKLRLFKKVKINDQEG